MLPYGNICYHMFLHMFQMKKQDKTIEEEEVNEVEISKVNGEVNGKSGRCVCLLFLLVARPYLVWRSQICTSIYTSNEIKSVIKKITAPILFKLFHKITEERMFLNSFYRANITLMPKPDKDITKKENCSLISLINIDEKILNKIFFKLNLAIH